MGPQAPAKSGMRAEREDRNMRKDHKSATVLIFVGFLLIAVFAIGLTASRNPDLLRSRYRVDATWEGFLRICAEWWIPAGVIGIPMFLISLGISLWREGKEGRKGRSGGA